MKFKNLKFIALPESKFKVTAKDHENRLTQF